MARHWFGSLFALLMLAFALAAPARAQERGSAVGEWVGGVSWSQRMVIYAWEINADRTFSSGRDGRGHDGGGAWSMRGTRLTLKYDDGFRYEGELSGDGYSGTAYGADGRVFGSFSMSRASRRAREVDADE